MSAVYLTKYENQAGVIRKERFRASRGYIRDRRRGRTGGTDPEETHAHDKVPDPSVPGAGTGLFAYPMIVSLALPLSEHRVGHSLQRTVEPHAERANRDERDDDDQDRKSVV